MFEDSAGLGVRNHFGPRDRNASGLKGSPKTEGRLNELVLRLNTAQVNAGDVGLAVLPKGALVTGVVVNVITVGALAGTTPAIEIGTDGSEVTNGFSIVEAVVEAVGILAMDDTDMQGTFALPLAADTSLGVSLSGAGAALTASLDMEVIISYLNASV